MQPSTPSHGMYVPYHTTVLTLQNILIPLLPESLLHYCCAPMPFIVGIHSDSLMALEAMPLEELVFVDLDYDRVASAESFDDDITLLPSPAVSMLKANLKAQRS